MATEADIDEITDQPFVAASELSLAHERRYGVRAETLSNIRWVAIAGQLITVLFVNFGLGFNLMLVPSLAVILLSIWFNIIATAFLPANARLSERVALGWLLFDAIGMAILLAMSGGLSNPFCILFLSTTTIAAAALTKASSRVTMVVCAILVVLVEVFQVPLVRHSGEVVVLPLIYRVGFGIALLVGIGFIGGYISRIAEETFRMSQALSATQLALSREHQLSSLGAMAAAAAHELGTPLATIALTAREMERELPEGSDQDGDLALIREQTARCRDILAELAGSQRRDVAQFHKAPLLSVLEEARAPFKRSEKEVIFTVNGQPVHDVAPMTPEIDRGPEVVQGIRNIIQNALDFAYSRVSIHCRIDEDRIEVRIEDDGAGFPSELLGRLGEPFITSRSSRKNEDSGYEGMGLGIFIAKTLLERRGVAISFFNRRTPRGVKDRGATVQLIWRRHDQGSDSSEQPAADMQLTPVG